jgi:GntR family transcriptional regulator, transcriptional repressor for pyruvate dehydrogenase complex
MTLSIDQLNHCKGDPVGQQLTSPKTEFEAIRRNKLYEEVADRLQRWILDEKKPGDKLPPERQLAEMFGVGRSSVRDAVRRLQAMGLVEPLQGHGTVVCEISDHSIISPLSSVLLRKWKLVAELLDVRKIIEPGIAARAAGNASPEHISKMEEILKRQSAKLSRRESAIEEDSEFHYCLALAADNSVVLRVLDVLMDLLQKSREQSLQLKGRPAKSLSGHRRIVAAIKRKDAAGAEIAMRQHLEEIETIIAKTSVEAETQND